MSCNRKVCAVVSVLLSISCLAQTVSGTGTVGKPGGEFQGGAGAAGATGTGGGYGGSGVVGQGAPGSTWDNIPAGVGVVGTGGVDDMGQSEPGGQFSAGVAATAGARTVAVLVPNGDIRLGAAAPSATAPIRNDITPLSIAKTWATFDTTGTGTGATVTIRNGLNLSGVVATSGHTFRLTFASAFANNLYAVTATAEWMGYVCSVGTRTTTTVDIAVWDAGNVALPDIYQAGVTFHWNVVVFGAQ